MSEDAIGTPAPADRALVSKVHVVDGAAIRFTEVGTSDGRDDTFDLEWDVTPEPAARAERPATAPPALPRRDLRSPSAAPAPAVPPAPMAPAPSPAAEPSRPAPAPSRPTRSDAQLGDESLETMPAVFHSLRPKDLQEAIAAFDVLDLPAGETLIGEGEQHPALVMVLRGQLSVTRGGTDPRRVGSGEALGFATFFGNGTWTTTVRTLSDCRLLVLELDGFRALRSKGSLVALTIEEYALTHMLDAQRRTAERVAELSKPQGLDQLIPRKGAAARLAAAFGFGGISAARVDALQALLAAAPFKNAERDHLAGLAARMGGVAAQPGELLVREGEDSAALYLLLSGGAEVLTAARGKDRAVRQEVLQPGDLLGGWSMVRGTPEWSTVVVTERATLLELDKLAWAELATARDATGSVLRLALLRSLSRRLHVAAARVAALTVGAPVPEPASEDARFVTINPASRR